MKPNCRRCYYGGVFVGNKGLASCDSARITEPTIIEYDKALDKAWMKHEKERTRRR